MSNTLRQEKLSRAEVCKTQSLALTRSEMAQTRSCGRWQIKVWILPLCGDHLLGTSPKRLAATLESLLLNVKSTHLVCRSPSRFQWPFEGAILLCGISWRRSLSTVNPRSAPFLMNTEYHSCASPLSEVCQEARGDAALSAVPDFAWSSDGGRFVQS